MWQNYASDQQNGTITKQKFMSCLSGRNEAIAKEGNRGIAASWWPNADLPIPEYPGLDRTQNGPMALQLVLQNGPIALLSFHLVLDELKEYDIDGHR
ncbi:hypothetical protein RUM43_013530 [Polyplax serrata]|uniref:Uncharacterized protein n=1 Tax=Polyplax serrata TaxID=468196 RepID=A0AAN8RYI7_POLSC